MTDTEKLLKVLDLSEEEQYHWVNENVKQEGYDSKHGFIPTDSFADLAFRLRDEVGAEWLYACTIVENYVFALSENRFTQDWWKHIRTEYKCNRSEGWSAWMHVKASPIHWIIAALIAKGLGD